MFDRAMTVIARRGYGWYLALKVLKVGSLPVVIVVWVAYVVASIAIIPLIHWGVETARVARAIPADFRHYFSKQWIAGFSRTHYRSLSQYKPAPVPLPPGDVI